MSVKIKHQPVTGRPITATDYNDHEHVFEGAADQVLVTDGAGSVTGVPLSSISGGGGGSFASLNGSPSDNGALAAALANKAGTGLTNTFTQPNRFEGKLSIGAADPLVGADRAGYMFHLQAGALPGFDTTPKPALKVERLSSHTDADLLAGGVAAESDAADAMSAIDGSNYGSSDCQAQVVGVRGYAYHEGITTSGTLSGTRPDACGVYGWGTTGDDGNAGVGIGGYFCGQRIGTSAYYTGIEVQARNDTLSSAAYSSNAFSSSAVWLVANGTADTGSAILVGNPFGLQFDYGIAFNAQVAGGKTGGVKTATILDDGNAATSIKINGTHATGIDLSGSTLSGAAVKLANNQYIQLGTARVFFDGTTLKKTIGGTTTDLDTTGGGGGGVTTFNTRSGDVALTSGDVTSALGYTPQISGSYAAASHGHAIADVTGLQPALDLKANLSSPALSGNPTAPTQPVSDSSTKLATTAHVKAANAVVFVSVSANYTLTQAEAAAGALFFDGTPTGPFTVNFGSGSAAFFDKPYVVVNATDYDITFQPCATSPLVSATIKANSSAAVFTFGNVLTVSNYLQNLIGTLLASQLPAFTGGDVTSSAGSAALAIGNNKVTRGMLAQTTGAAILGSTGAGNVADLTGSQVRGIIGLSVGTAAPSSPAVGDLWVDTN